MFAAALLVAVNDALLTRAYGSLPVLIGGEWNWQAKLLALAATLAIAASSAFGFRRVGLTIAQEPGSMKAALPVAALYCAFFAVIAMAFPSGRSSGEEIAFQLTMPGLEEEPFYRGILLFALDQAFTGRKRFLGVALGLGCRAVMLPVWNGARIRLFARWLFLRPYADGVDGNPFVHRRLDASADW